MIPPLLRDRPLALRVGLAVVLPVVWGVVCGWLLGVNDVTYLVATVLAILGGFGAGFEHLGWREGVARGLLGGTLFGSFLLIAHEVSGEKPTVELPDPAILFLLFTVIPGALLGALGGRARAKREPARSVGD